MAVAQRSWQRDKAWADQFSRALQHILGEIFVATALEIEDQQGNTDDWCTIRGQRIAVRIRNARDYDQECGGSMGQLVDHSLPAPKRDEHRVAQNPLGLG